MSLSTQPSRAKDAARNSSHVSSACTSCRRKHVKCDGQGDGNSSVCSRCVETGNECVWTVAQDRRVARGCDCTQYNQRLAKLEAEVELLKGRLSIAAPQMILPGAATSPLAPVLGPAHAPALFAQTSSYAYANAFQHEAHQPAFAHPRLEGACTFHQPALALPQPALVPRHEQSGQADTTTRSDAFVYTAPLYVAGEGDYQENPDDGWTA